MFRWLQATSTDESDTTCTTFISLDSEILATGTPTFAAETLPHEDDAAPPNKSALCCKTVPPGSVTDINAFAGDLSATSARHGLPGLPQDLPRTLQPRVPIRGPVTPEPISLGRATLSTVDTTNSVYESATSTPTCHVTSPSHSCVDRCTPDSKLYCQTSASSGDHLGDRSRGTQWYPGSTPPPNSQACTSWPIPNLQGEGRSSNSSGGTEEDAAVPSTRFDGASVACRGDFTPDAASPSGARAASPSLASRSPTVGGADVACPSPRSPPLSCATPGSGSRPGNDTGSSDEDEDDASDGAVSGDGDGDMDSVQQRFQTAVIQAVRNQLEVEAEKELLRKLAEATGAASRGGAPLPAGAKWAKGAGRPMEATTRRLAACFERAIQDAMEARTPPSAANWRRSAAGAAEDATGSAGLAEGLEEEIGAVRTRLMEFFDRAAHGRAQESDVRDAVQCSGRDDAVCDAHACGHGSPGSRAQEMCEGVVAGQGQVSCLLEVLLRGGLRWLFYEEGPHLEVLICKEPDRKKIL